MVCVFTFIVTATLYGSAFCLNSFEVPPNLSTSVFQVTGACAIPMPGLRFQQVYYNRSKAPGITLRWPARS